MGILHDVQLLNIVSQLLSKSIKTELGYAGVSLRQVGAGLSGIFSLYPKIICLVL